MSNSGRMIEEVIKEIGTSAERFARNHVSIQDYGTQDQRLLAQRFFLSLNKNNWQIFYMHILLEALSKSAKGNIWANLQMRNEPFKYRQDLILHYPETINHNLEHIEKLLKSSHANELAQACEKVGYYLGNTLRISSAIADSDDTIKEIHYFIQDFTTLTLKYYRLLTVLTEVLFGVDFRNIIKIMVSKLMAHCKNQQNKQALEMLVIR